RVLAAVGLLGALVVPLLVASVTPSILGLNLYIALIVAVALWLAARRSWGWLEACALGGATVWLTFPMAEDDSLLNFGLGVAGLAIVTALLLRRLVRAPALPNRAVWSWFGWLGFIVLTALWNDAGGHWTPASLALPVLFTLCVAALSLRGEADRRWPALMIVAVLFAVIFPSLVRPDWLSEIPGWSALSALMAGGLALVSLSVANRVEAPRVATALVGTVGVALLVLATSRMPFYDAQFGVDAVLSGFVLAGLFGVAVIFQPRSAVQRAAMGLFVLCWAVATFGLGDHRPELTLPETSLLLSGGFALGLLWILRRTDEIVRSLGVVLGGLAGWVAMTAVAESATHISVTPWFNELWLFFGVPGGVAAAGAVALSRLGGTEPNGSRPDLAVSLLRAGACVFAGLLLVFLMHHALNGGDLQAEVGFEDLAVQLLVAFALMAGLAGLRGQLLDWPDGRPVTGAEIGPFLLPGLAVGVSLLSLSAFAALQLVGWNPLFTSDTRIGGHPVFNALLIGYGLPAGLLAWMAWRAQGRRPVWFVRSVALLAGLSWLAWITAQIRRLAHGSGSQESGSQESEGQDIAIEIGRVPWDNVELYAVSAAWLLTGLAVLAAGSWTQRRDLRLASAALITLTTLKVFLVDMSELEGALRALSFIGLGVALIGIGRLYQRVLSGKQANEA
ncbi:MAG: DUF2339 domain-containing protein, partial [Litorimonas sp.]